MFEVMNLNKIIKGRAILNDLSFKLKKGEVGIFLGKSGVGKSTLLRILNHLESADSGKVILEGNVLDLSKANNIGLVFQHFNLFEHLNVEENITLCLRKVLGKTADEAHTIAFALLKRYGLEEKAKSSVQKLSGGQKQRLAIARTLALNPEVICLDEPTSALDPLLTQQMAQYISELAHEGKTVLITTHDLGLVEKLQGTLFLMQAGKIVETCASEAYKSKSSDYPLLDAFLSCK